MINWYSHFFQKTNETREKIILRALKKVFQVIHLFYGRIDNFQNCFRDLLTFRNKMFLSKWPFYSNYYCSHKFLSLPPVLTYMWLTMVTSPLLSCITDFRKYFQPWTADTQWRHKSNKSENLDWCSRQNMICPYLKI